VDRNAESFSRKARTLAKIQLENTGSSKGIFSVFSSFEVSGKNAEMSK
jgi:hypothetical protein